MNSKYIKLFLWAWGLLGCGVIWAQAWPVDFWIANIATFFSLAVLGVTYASASLIDFIDSSFQPY